MQEIHLNGQSRDIVEENVAKLKELFPEIVTEDNIDFDELKAVLGDYIEKNEESYRFTWYGKRDAFRKSQIPSTGTLRPCVEESKDWDTTQNLYIEGDNLEVLKLLQKSYNNQVKIIYIDPPYNKDKDFIYPDKWSDPIKGYKKITGQIDEDGNITRSDTEDEGGRHTKWLNMMYPRLRLAKNLLKDEGVIFISIDDEELSNLKKLCNEVFGEENFVEYFLWTKTSTPPSLSNKSRKTVEFVLCYEKKKNNYKYFGSDLDNGDAPLLNTGNPRKNLVFPIGAINFTFTDSAVYKAGQYEKTELINDIIVKGGKNVNEVIINGEFKWAQDNLNEEISKGTYFLIKSEKFSIRFQRVGNDEKYKTPNNLLNVELNKENEVGTNESAVKELEALGLKGTFDYPKPISLLEKVIKMIAKDDKECIILDFFAGSSTTAHAVLKINSEDNGRRRYIMVQLPENLDILLANSDAISKKSIQNSIEFLDSISKPHYLSELGKERIRRAGENIKLELKAKYDDFQKKQQSILEDEEQPPMNPEDLDIGFKVFKLDNSNLKKWSVDVDEDFYKESKEAKNAILSKMLGLEVDNFVEDRSELDVVCEIMLKYGLGLTYPIESYDIDGVNIYSIGCGGLIVCLDTNIRAELAEKIVKLINKLAPSTVRVAVRDLSFRTDSEKTNFKETIKNGVYAYFESIKDKANIQNQFKFITI